MTVPCCATVNVDRLEPCTPTVPPNVSVELVGEGSLAEAANLGREGKARRLLDLRRSTTGQPA